MKQPKCCFCGKVIKVERQIHNSVTGNVLCLPCAVRAVGDVMIGMAERVHQHGGDDDRR